jgi:integrase
MTSGRLPVHALRPEDVDLVNQWLRARAGIDPEPITIAELYQSDNAPPQQFWSEVTCDNTRKWILAFARRSRAPLRAIGLLPGGTFTPESVREEIQAYAMDYAARNAARIEALATLIAAEKRNNQNPLPWRTPGWTAFVDTGTEFYNWLERQGLRPRGSNPFLDIVRLPNYHIRHEIVVVEAWYKKIFNHPKTLKQAAVISLLANGLRCREVARARAADFTFSPDIGSTLRIVGKGNKVRTVILYDKTAQVVVRWLQSQQFVGSQWIFPGRKRGKPITISSIGYLVKRLCDRVFPAPEEARIRRRISPHKFRHWYTSDALFRGMKAGTVQAQLGHASQVDTRRYAHMDPEWVRRDVQAVDHGDFYNVPRTADGQPVLLRQRLDVPKYESKYAHEPVDLW